MFAFYLQAPDLSDAILPVPSLVQRSAGSWPRRGPPVWRRAGEAHGGERSKPPHIASLLTSRPLHFQSRENNNKPTAPAEGLPLATSPFADCLLRFRGSISSRMRGPRLFPSYVGMPRETLPLTSAGEQGAWSPPRRPRGACLPRMGCALTRVAGA
ncbi:uncharacterized protein ACOB8E_002120 [Sarcophilus harrisii]